MRETWPERPDLIAIDGKTSRRSHDRAAGKAPLHLVSAFATTGSLVLGQEAVAEKAGEVVAIREIETFFADAPPAGLDSDSDVDKGHGRFEERTVTVAREVDWLTGERPFPARRACPTSRR